MSKLAYHVGHYKQGQIGAIAGHNFEHRSEYATHSNPDIDPARSRENIVLMSPASGSLYLDAKSRIHAAVTGRVRSDSNWLTETITYPPEGMADREQLRRYFQDVLRWHWDTFGAENILAATVHLDETTPHMHLDLTPITADGRLSTKAIFTRAALTAQQTSLAAYLSGKGWDIQRGEAPAPGQAKKRSRTVRQYKAEAEAQKAELAADLARLSQKQAQAEAALETVTEALEAAQATLSAQEVEALQGRKTLTGGLKGVTWAEFDRLKQTAVKVETMAAERDAAKAQAAKAEQRAEAAEVKALDAQDLAYEATEAAANARAEARAELDDERDALRADFEKERAEAWKKLENERAAIQQERPSFKAQMQIAQLENQVSKLQKRLDAIMNIVFERGVQLWREYVAPLHQEDDRVWTFSQAWKIWRNRNRTPEEHAQYNRSPAVMAEVERLSLGAGGIENLQRGIMEKLGAKAEQIANVLRSMRGDRGQNR